MSFTGNLEDLAIVDVIQLLHSARKSGTLCVNSGKREAQLVFDGGYIVSANHPDSRYQIGKILIEMKALTDATLESALQKQREASERKPLIGLLIEDDIVDRQTAFKGLEILIEMTVVEMVSWHRGSFTLDVDNISIADEYRYFPEKLHQEMTLDTQMVLMDALRIYDEKKRDGEIAEVDEGPDEPAAAAVSEPEAEVLLEEDLVEVEPIDELEPLDEVDAEAAAPAAEESLELSADLLGLDQVDQLEARIPEVFASLPTFDPADIHRQMLAQATAALSAEQRETLAGFLTQYSTSISIEEATSRNRQPRALLLFSNDELLRHLLMTICKHEGVMVFVARDQAELFNRTEQVSSRGMLPMAVFDLPLEDGGSLPAAELAAVRHQFGGRYPQALMVQLGGANASDYSGQAYLDGVKAVFNRPADHLEDASFVAETQEFLEKFREFVISSFNDQGQQLFRRLSRQMQEVQELRDIPSLALALMQATAEQFSRCLTLIVSKSELVAERGIGLSGPGSELAAAPACRLSLAQPSVLRRVIETGELYFGPCDDGLLGEQLYAAIGAPVRSNILLLPLCSRGRTISLTYADFGDEEPVTVVPEMLQILARHAGLVLENVLYRRQLAKQS